MTATRFATIRDLFEEFPTLAQSAKPDSSDVAPVAHVRRLVREGRRREAVAICAYLLRRREAVWWSCQCLRLRPGIVSEDNKALLAAEHWARTPSEEARDIAQKWGLSGDQTAPATWAAHAAGYTNGTMALQWLEPVRVQKHLTVDSARCAVLLAETKLEQKDVPGFLEDCVNAALNLLEQSQPASH